ncbi:unnamed protein product [Fructobacillus cardui]|nr:unnamed protein product [Fructobacillus cardui]
MYRRELPYLINTLFVLYNLFMKYKIIIKRNNKTIAIKANEAVPNILFSSLLVKVLFPRVTEIERHI